MSEENLKRVAFERWANKKYNWELFEESRDESDRTLSSWSGERYDNRIVEGMWQAWQGYGASIVVELPPPYPMPEEPEFADDDSYMDAYYAAKGMRHACGKAIEAAGLKVAS